ncbi:MAG: UvrD-helicase domain-containing protein, partial [Acidobacteriota bacterium]|nr:UvrD-helicase domain-containing protein [Acidobacteriota bacterium]
TTIHGFCSRLLREFPVEAVIDPQFILLDEHQAALLLEKAVEESLTEFINSGNEGILRLTAGLGRGRLASALVEIYRQIRGQGLSLSLLAEQSSKSHSTWEQFLSGLTEVDRHLNHLISFGRLADKAEAKRQAAERNWPRLLELFRDNQLPLGDFCRELSEFREGARPDARGPVGEIVKRLDELLWSDNREKPFGSVPQIRFDIAAKDYACESIKILKNVDRRLREAKHQLAALDFDDLQLRVLQLLEQPEVLLRASRRYKFFLVDEFQDTNSIQRDLMNRLALSHRKDANLFIVGDRKQSIYGFRGADVDVFREMTEALVKAGGSPQPLHLNFRSQPPVINFLNLLFGRLFQPGEEINPQDLGQLGYVEHEPSIAERETVDHGPLVELMVDTIAEPEDPKAKRTTRERDAQQLARRINSLTANTAGTPADTQEPDATPPRFEYRDIALLFRAMTDVPVYESIFRRAGIPYQTVLGKGFYEREEIRDLIQLLRFLDNRTDELALAAVLRSPLCGISDDALLALRLGPRIGETPAGEAPEARRRPRKLFRALRQQREIDFIASEEREALERATTFLQSLIEKRNRYPVGDLLRFAVNTSEYTTVVAANFDGAQRLANIQKLFVLAERFERSGAHLIRDFVKYVHDFEVIGSRESEGQLDDTANAVKLMTIHQAKGLEFPVVIIPDLQRISAPRDNWFTLDRHLGLTLKVPNGRGDQVAGSTFKTFSDR